MNEEHSCEGFDDYCYNKNATYNRQYTSYTQDELNFRWFCPDCQKLSNAYWEEMWEEYYRERL